MYDFTVDEFPIDEPFPVTRSVHTGCNVGAGGCLSYASDGTKRRTRASEKVRANRAYRHAVRQVLHTWKRVRVPRKFTCWDII